MPRQRGSWFRPFNHGHLLTFVKPVPVVRGGVMHAFPKWGSFAEDSSPNGSVFVLVHDSGGASPAVHTANPLCVRFVGSKAGASNKPQQEEAPPKVIHGFRHQSTAPAAKPRRNAIARSSMSTSPGE